MRRLRYVIDRLLIYAGVVIILGTLLFIAPPVVQASIVLIGLLLVQLGVWRVASALLPSVRTNQGLRDQVDLFITLVREIYRAANAHDAAEFEAVAAKMRDRTEDVINAAKADLS